MNRFEQLIDQLDPEQGGPLLSLTSQERHEVARFVEKLRQWGRYNTVVTDLSPFLTDAKTVIEGELSREILQYAKETGEFPVNMKEFMVTQPEELQYIWENAQKMSENLSMGVIQDVFKTLSQKIYRAILTGPYLERVQNRT